MKTLNPLKKWILFWLWFWLTTFWVAYAASITSTTDSTVSSWDSITANWYQDVNNKLWGISVSSGNIGVWITNPSAKLHVAWSINVWYWSTNWILSWSDSWLDDWIGNTKLIIPGWETWRWDYVDFYTVWNWDDDEGVKMSIIDNGNVWIWTITPSQKLHVEWWWAKFWNASLANSYLNLEAHGWFHRMAFDELRFYDWGDHKDLMTINAWKVDINGNLSVWNNYVWETRINKSFDFPHAISNVPSSLSLWMDDWSYAWIVINNERDTNNHNSQSIDFHTHHWAVSAWVRMRIDKGGQVGIWTTSPTAKLDVNWVIKAQGQPHIFGSPTNTNWAWIANSFYTETSRWWLVWSNDRINITVAWVYMISLNTISDSGSWRVDAKVLVNWTERMNLLNEINWEWYHQKSWTFTMYLNVWDNIQFSNNDWYNASVTNFQAWRTASVTMIN